MLKKVFLFTLLLVTINAQIGQWGNCPEAKPKNPFAYQTFMYKWYEISKYVNAAQLLDKCVVTSFQNNATTNQRSYDYYSVDNRTNQASTNKIYLEMPNANEGVLNAYYSENSRKNPSKLIVLETDYSTYALIYRCSSIMGFFRYENLWLLSRANTLAVTPDVEQIGNMQGVKLNKNWLIKTDHTGCPTGY